MRLSLTRYLMAVLCMLAAGTWILPVHTLAAPAPAPAAPIDDGDETVALLALRDAIEAMRLAGEFDRAPFAFNGADLTGDGVTETMEVFPPQRLETPGFMRVIDGATSAERYTLRAPAGEMGFGELAAVVADCDVDGLPDIAIGSWRDLRQPDSPWLVELRVRVFSGSNGSLIGLVRSVRDLAQATGPLESDADTEVVIAADANEDGAINAADIVEGCAAFAHDTALAPTVDCDIDGELSLSDLGFVAQRVMDEPFVHRVELHSMKLRNIGFLAAIAPPGAGTDPTSMGGGGGAVPPCTVTWQGGMNCYLGLLAMLALTATLVAKIALCSGPQAPACIYWLLCGGLTVLAGWSEFYNRCFHTAACVSPVWTTINQVIALVGAVCGLVGTLQQNWSRFVEMKDAFLELLKRLRQTQP